MTVPLNPTQHRMLEQLRRRPDAVEPVPDELSEELHAELEDGLRPSLVHLGGERFAVNKHALATIHVCERYELGTHRTFEWSARTARGTVAHKAIQLGVNWRGEPHAAALVDEALARLIDGDDTLAAFLGSLPEGGRAELRSDVVDLVTSFQECFPPLLAAWRPNTETPVRVDLFDGLIRLHGRVDLALGAPNGLEPGKVIVDFKTGAPAAQHREDLRFYALLEAIRLGVPPRIVASCYLDAGRLESETVTRAVLAAAVARTVDGVRKLIETRHAVRAAAVTPGPACGWCALRPDCSEGRAWWEERRDRL